MALRLILNADDFGLTSGINRAIATLYQAGALTSATLMATGPAFDGAVATSHSFPNLGVGCHIVLVDGIPVSPPASVPTLLGRDGKHLRSSLLDFTQALLRGAIKPDEIAREALAQIQRLQRAGIRITHLDTHKHTHLFPAVAAPLLRLAEDCAIPAIRNPFEPVFSRRLGHAPATRTLQIALLNRFQPGFTSVARQYAAHVLTTDGTVGISATGNLTASSLTEILDALPAIGTYELCCHPGYNDADLDRIVTRLRSHRETEVGALLACIPQGKKHPNAPELIHYGMLRKPISTAAAQKLL